MKFLIAIFLTVIQIITMTMELAMISLSINQRENKYKCQKWQTYWLTIEADSKKKNYIAILRMMIIIMIKLNNDPEKENYIDKTINSHFDDKKR